MSIGWRISLIVVCTLLIFGSAAVPGFGETARFPGGDLVTGIVERVEGDLLTVDGAVYDTKNVPVRFSQGMSPLEKPLLQGKTVQILIRNRKIDSLLVFPPLPY